MSGLRSAHADVKGASAALHSSQTAPGRSIAQTGPEGDPAKTMAVLPPAGKIISDDRRHPRGVGDESGSRSAQAVEEKGTCSGWTRPVPVALFRRDPFDREPP